ncbi:MAG TPA: methyltransferase [Rubrobacteraceae bacterium]|nr:methyltransferase [Rubrobacteraceae bacterium]
MKQEKVTTTEWDAASYEELADPMTRWGAKFLELVELRGDEAVVDAGCGTGRVTELLLGRLTGGTVLAVDVSEKMVAAAAERFAGDERVKVERQDLLELNAGDPVDVIFSTATFHWILDHDRLFRRLSENLKPGGLLAAQCGGTGNVARVLETAQEIMREERFRETFDGWTDAKHFADPETTKACLERAGFEKIETWLHEEPTKFDSVEKLAPYLRTVILRQHVAELPEDERDAFVRAVAGRMAEKGMPVVDYVRLNILARRSG